MSGNSKQITLQNTSAIEKIKRSKMANEKDRILKYFEEQLVTKEDSLARHEAGTNDDQNEIKCLMSRREIAEIKRHLSTLNLDEI